MVATYFLAFRVDRGPFARKEVRQAISRAIRRDELALALGTGDVPSDGWVPQGLEGSRDLQSPVPHLALSTLDLPSPGPLLVFDQGERNRLILEKVQADLKKRLGVNLRLEGKDWKSHVRGLAEGRFQMYRFGWVAPFLDPITHLQVFTSQNPNNFTAWRDPRYDSMVERISALAPGTERAQKIREADLYLTREESIVVPLLHYVQSYAVAPRVRGLRALPNLVIPFRELTLE
jgi:oligopeptide transport system substrate-binding protein